MSTSSSSKEPERTESNELRSIVADLNSRMQILESKLTGINEKLDSTRQNLDQLASAPKVKPTVEAPPKVASGVINHPASNAGASIEPLTSPHDSEAGFTNDSTVQEFRKAMILFLGQKYSESILAFSEFLERNPDHPLAGSAQFYIGDAYFKQKEFKLALKEFQRVLTSYDRSPHIADTLERMAAAEDTLKKTAEAGKHRQMLTSLFPHSPAMLALKETHDNPAAPATENPASTHTDSTISELDQPPIHLSKDLENSDQKPHTPANSVTVIDPKPVLNEVQPSKNERIAHSESHSTTPRVGEVLNAVPPTADTPSTVTQ